MRPESQPPTRHLSLVRGTKPQTQTEKVVQSLNTARTLIEECFEALGAPESVDGSYAQVLAAIDDFQAAVLLQGYREGCVSFSSK